MRVAMLNATDTAGGAARAAYRLHRGLIDMDVESRMFVLSRGSRDDTVRVCESTRVERWRDRLYDRLPVDKVSAYPRRSGAYFSGLAFSRRKLVERVNAFNPDVIHLHWINDNLLSLSDLSKFRAPIAWTFHDMWPFTGGCHYDDGCGRFAQVCGACPILGSDKNQDLTAAIFRAKQSSYHQIAKLTVVSLSSWMTESVRKSALMGDREIVDLPNPIDTSVFRPIAKSAARAILNIDEDSTVIAYGAMNASEDARKGYSELKDALDRIKSKGVRLLLFGTSKADRELEQRFRVKVMGELHDDLSLVAAYNAADVFVVPSRQETLVQTAVEALSCGTPVVAFRTTGLTDIVDHRMNGYLAAPFDPQELAEGIDWVLSDRRLWERLSHEGRQKVMDHFEKDKVVRSYIAMYQKLISADRRQI